MAAAKPLGRRRVTAAELLAPRRMAAPEPLGFD